MKLVDSHKKQLDYGEIMHQYHSNEKQTDKRLEDFKIWLITTAAAFAKINGEGSIIGNTFFYYRRGPEGHEHEAMVWAMNADTMQNMVENIAEGISRLVDEGVTEVIAIYKSPMVSRIMRQAFSKIESPGDKLTITKTPKGGVVMRMHLAGDEHV